MGKSVDKASDFKESFFDDPEYAYMKKMVSSEWIDGWLWEFIRRNKNYRKAHCELKKIVHGKLTIAEIGRASKILEQVKKEFGVPVIWVADPKEELSSKYAEWIPDPSLRYDQITKTGKPLILRQDEMISLSDKELATRVSKLNTRALKTGQVSDNDLILAAVRYFLAPVQHSHSIYIGISTRARRNEVQKKVARIISRSVGKQKRRSPQIRADVWRRYLQVFDRREKGDTTAQLAALLHKERSSKSDPQQAKEMIREYHKQAKRLINNDYNKLLF